MRFKHLIIFVAFCGVLVLANEEKQQVAEEKTSEQVQEEIQQEEAYTSNDERVETISADINFNSWSELYDYIKELEEATTGQELEEGEDRGATLRLELMTDGDALTLEGNNNNNNQQDEREGVVVHGTISDVIREVPAPDLSIKKEMLIGDEDVKAQEPDRPQIVATEADWTFIQDTLKKIDNQETILAKRAKDEAESMEEELTEEEKKGKEIFDKAKQMRASTRSNRKQAHNLYVEAAQHGYIPAKEKVAWFNLLSATTEEKLIEARKSFDELVPLGRSDSQMVCIGVINSHTKIMFLTIKFTCFRLWDLCLPLESAVWRPAEQKLCFIIRSVLLEALLGLKWLWRNCFLLYILHIMNGF